MCAWCANNTTKRVVIQMFINTRSVSATWLLIILMVMPFIDAEAADPSRRQCNDTLIVTEAQQLMFGDFASDALLSGTITVTPGGARTTTGPFLAGGTVSAGVISVYSQLNGCDIYPVRIRYRRNNPLSGAGLDMPINTFDPPRDTLFTISPLANVPTTVNFGANLDVGAGQTEGPYTGTYRVRFSHRRP
jgi:Domain of unknown function (DUF4402)